MKDLLFINACVRKDSRTKMLADKLLAKLGADYEEVFLENVKFPNVNSIFSTFSFPDENGVNANIKPNIPLSSLFIIKLTLIVFGSLYIIPLWEFPLVKSDLNISKLFIEFLSIKIAFWGY